MIGAALALPIIVLVVLQAMLTFGRERADIERQTIARAEQVMALVMARVEADFALMQVLATADPFEQGDWPYAYARAREVAALNPHWRDVRLTNPGDAEPVFTLLGPYSRRGGRTDPALTAEIADVGDRLIGSVRREGEGCPCVYLHIPVQGVGRTRNVLSVALDPDVFRSALMRHLPEDSVAALVSRDGLFITRSVQQEERVGTTATNFVRDAIASGERSGIYSGRTFEGFQNYTAFVVSPSSGWSVHIAVNAALLDRPRAYTYVTLAIGALLALALAAGLIAYALRELSQRRLQEARLAQTQKLEAIGQLTGGVAHDFNNLLTVIIGGLNMLLKRIEDPKQRQIAEHMLDAAQRGDKLTKQLLAFSRGQQMELAPVDLHQMIAGMEDLLRRSIDPGMALNFNLHPDARWVNTNANQLELAVLNLAINARDAMIEGGRIEISVQPSERTDSIDLIVADNGMGMPKDVADRAFEPFYTTKPAGKGTGLGLSQVFGAARQSGGSIDIDTAPGRGTSVRITLPRAGPPAEAPPAEVEAEPAPVVSQGRRVLVVDDEPGVRSFMAETLREAGYNAVEAEDVGVALRLLETDPPELLLTDYSMPGMHGLELAERARARDAQLRVLIVSGYADAEALSASEARPALLRKPFDARALLDAVRDVFAA